MNEKLDLTSFKKAIDSIEEFSLALKKNPDITAIEAGIIQAFEYTFELSRKMLKRYLINYELSEEEVENMHFSDLIRTGNEYGLLLSDWSVWSEFRKKRNITTHTYDEAKAEEVLSIVPKFYEEALFLYNKLFELTNKE